MAQDKGQRQHATLGPVTRRSANGSNIAIRGGAITETKRSKQIKTKTNGLRRPNQPIRLPTNLASAQRLAAPPTGQDGLKQEAKEQLQAAVNDLPLRKAGRPAKPNKPARRRKVGSSAIRDKRRIRAAKNAAARVVNITRRC